MSKTSDDKEKTQIDTPKANARRRLLQLLAVGGVASTSKLVPEQWSKPIVDSVVLPGHAQTSPVVMVGSISNVNAALESAPSSLASAGKKALDFVIPEAVAQPGPLFTDAYGQCISVSASAANGPVTVEITNVGTQNGTLSGLNFSLIFPHPAGDFTVSGSINEAFTQATGTVTDPRDPNDSGIESCEDSFTATVGGSCTPNSSSVLQYRYCPGNFIFD